MKYRDLARALNERGGAHEKWTNGRHSIAVPRHREITERTAEAILRQAARYNRLKDEDHEE